MKSYRRYSWGLLALVLVISACSTTKDAFMNRNWHALNTKYNVLYNGNIAFEEGREELNASYVDDYWEILPVERMAVRDEVKLDSEDNHPKFAIAEEKATKAVQKHGMEIKDRERNPQTDEAFLLLGKARYFDQRFIPALEAFNYILRKHTYSDKLTEARIWREKTNLRLENVELAIENLKKLFKYDELTDQEYADARAVMAQAYINQKVLDTAIHQLKIASTYTKSKAEKGRYYYIIGQLFDRMGHKDSANYAYNKIIELKRKSPRVYMINAEVAILRNTEITDQNREAILEHFTKLAENRENRPYLDKVYRGFARYHMNNGEDAVALDYYDKSLRATQGDDKLNALNYEDLADYYFDRYAYKDAGAYYDSTLTNLQEHTLKARRIRKKLDNLEDVIAYEEVVSRTDSIVKVYGMKDIARRAYYQEHIDAMIAEEEAKAQEEEAKMEQGFATFMESPGGQENQGKFYFYNVTSLGYGKTKFQNYWGNRKLEDNWRWANKSIIQQEDIAIAQQIDTTGAAAAMAVAGRKYELDYYLEQIPNDPKVIDSLKAEKNFANYQLGLIYKEKFKENVLAAGKLESVLANAPEKRLILPSKYNLYKIYQEEGSPLADQMRQDIVQNHPTSRYALIIQNPELVLEGDSNGPDATYNGLYRKYQAQEYLQVMVGTEEAISRFTGDAIVPKLEMLKANANGRLNGFQAYRESLNYVALTYPNNEEGKKAQDILDNKLSNLAKREFSKTGTGNWKVVFPLAAADTEKIAKLKERLEQSIKDLKYRNTVSQDLYDLTTQFVVVHGFSSQDRALGYAELIKNNKDYRIKDRNFVILSGNYAIVQIHKNLEDYRKGLLTPKP
ncbi:type IX secretion system periplasmic lipoprotein PorW/SprE [Sediminicola luteus]|uniref:type IX secretion system periplasmic lipoprotein PorW/SprE n=1 Tax=Sediminicola luteus TaxID=319238 RepID=UPI000BE5F740|nr:hypothetical protein [Sediminicola luteus]